LARENCRRIGLDDFEKFSGARTHEITRFSLFKKIEVDYYYVFMVNQKFYSFPRIGFFSIAFTLLFFTANMPAFADSEQRISKGMTRRRSRKFTVNLTRSLTPARVKRGHIPKAYQRPLFRFIALRIIQSGS
jgi:hypothetical protein